MLWKNVIDSDKAKVVDIDRHNDKPDGLKTAGFLDQETPIG